jgi:hypothetical protein
MTDLQWLALGAPVVLVALVTAIVVVEELINQGEMRRERAAAGKKVRQEPALQMTVELSQSDFGKLADGYRTVAKSRSG